jgi:gamma-tubulin complex component 3
LGSFNRVQEIYPPRSRRLHCPLNGIDRVPPPKSSLTCRDSLDRPANTLYRHNLTATLESAIRGSNAQFESPEILRRLDARMLELSHGEIGWDVFTLEYKIDAPLDVIVTPYCARQYLKVFNFLWRVKRVEFAITGAWKRSATGARGVLAQVDDIVGKDWKRIRGGSAEMIHFLCQLQYYILFEVLRAYMWLN